MHLWVLVTCHPGRGGLIKAFVEHDQMNVASGVSKAHSSRERTAGGPSMRAARQSPHEWGFAQGCALDALNGLDVHRCPTTPDDVRAAASSARSCLRGSFFAGPARSTRSAEGTGERLRLDHCHATRKMRGLLSRNCNTGLVRFKTDSGSLISKTAILSAKGK
ncbi:endonuclease domain-containing protein [Arthrobacter sp. NPDC058192]|uniref:endonuclease domain-containing protein n=1 Tax=Arthrobacter sp. NPDC058192 TaxID=3346372 RepID=UPI0036E2FF7E